MTRPATPGVALPPQPFLRSELLAQGVSRGAFYRLRAQGVIRAVLREVYVDAALPDTFVTRAAAAALVVAPGHVAVDRTAAAVHGVDALAYVEHETLPPVEACVVPGRRGSKRAGVRGRERDLGSEDVMKVAGMAVTTPLRTALDLGCHLRRREAFGAMCTLARRHGFGASDLCAALPRFAGRRGVVQLRELAPLVDPRFESPREAWVWLSLHDARLPLPEPQVQLEWEGGPTYRLDFGYRRAQVCVEYDGEDFHGPDRRADDERRRAWLRARGWTVIIVRRGDFSGAALDRWLGEVRRALGATYTTRRW